MKRRLLFSVIPLLGFAAFGQSAPKHDPPTDQVPKIEIPVGFSFVNVHPSLAPITSFNVFGGLIGDHPQTTEPRFSFVSIV